MTVMEREKEHGFNNSEMKEALQSLKILFCVQIINGWMIVVDAAKPNPPRYNRNRAGSSS